MIYIFLGPPGSGKGTQAKKLAEKLNLPHIAPGDMLRDAVKNETEIGKIAKQFIEFGKLVPDEVVINLTKERVAKDDAKNGFIIDGFPRSAAQAEALEGIINNRPYQVIYIDVPLSAVVERNEGRLSCPVCGAVYHIKNRPPKVAGKCDKDGADLYQRKDDTKEIMVTRFQAYNSSTVPLVAYYQKKNKILKIDGNRNMDDVFSTLQAELKV